MSEEVLRGLLVEAMFCYLRIKNKEYKFDLNDPIPCDDKEHGKTNKDYHVIFDATKHDPNFSRKTIYHVVTDGNQVTSRRLREDEKPFVKKRRAGAPKKIVPKGKIAKTMKRPASVKAASKGKLLTAMKRPASMVRIIRKKPAITFKRCKYVAKIDEAKASRTHIGGLFATVDMEHLPSKGNLVLHLVEMLNNENKGIKQFSILDLKKSNVHVGEYCHDCSCQFKNEWEQKGYATSCKLDGFHWETHKCDVEKVTNPRFNSQAAEQLWSRLDTLHFMTEYGRSKYRYFLREYCKWRNAFLRLTRRADANPCVSHRQVHHHG
jgi:hypothetical protein